MKKKELKDLRSKDIKELEKMVVSKKEESQTAKIKVGAAQEKNLKASKNLKIEIAKIMTIIREKEIVEGMKKEETK